MERPVARQKAAHLVCNSRFRSVIATAVCAYFAYSSYLQLREGEFFWRQDWWYSFTWLVWLVLIVAVMTETLCSRERVLFVLAGANFLVGAIFSVWSSASSTTVHLAREIFLALWLLATVASLATFKRPPISTEPHV